MHKYVGNEFENSLTSKYLVFLDVVENTQPCFSKYVSVQPAGLDVGGERRHTFTIYGGYDVQGLGLWFGFGFILYLSLHGFYSCSKYRKCN